jgi:alpha-galactosidase
MSLKVLNKSTKRGVKMKYIFKITTLAFIVLSMSVSAHSDGHGKLKSNQVIEIAQQMAMSLTFKANDTSVGKIPQSWSKVAIDKFHIVEEGEEAYVVKGTNQEANQSLYFLIDKTGKMIDVKDVKSFNKGHGHSH